MNPNNYKWLIPSRRTSQSIDQEREDWDEDHEDYSKTVFSITQDPAICKTLIHPSSQFTGYNIPDSPEIQVLIPGCGSEIYLQETLLNFCPHIGQVYCTDLSPVAIEKAQTKWQQSDSNDRLNNSPLHFECIDSTKITEQKPGWKNKFDYLLVVNSVLSLEDELNREMLKEFFKVLKPGGKLYGFFPTVFCLLEIAHLYPDKAHWITSGGINIPESASYPPDGKNGQIHYTPLRLNRIFKEVGFKRLSFEIYFGDSDILINALKEYGGIDDPDICMWEFLVRLEKEVIRN
jgi:SAM-dependent methyltransferase